MSLPPHNGALAVVEMQFPGKDNAESEGFGACVWGVKRMGVCVGGAVCTLCSSKQEKDRKKWKKGGREAEVERRMQQSKKKHV